MYIDGSSFNSLICVGLELTLCQLYNRGILKTFVSMISSWSINSIWTANAAATTKSRGDYLLTSF